MGERRFHAEVVYPHTHSAERTAETLTAAVENNSALAKLVDVDVIPITGALLVLVQTEELDDA